MIFAFFPEVVQNHKKSPIVKLSLPICQFSLNFKKKNRILATFTYNYNISYERQNPKSHVTPNGTGTRRR